MVSSHQHPPATKRQGSKGDIVTPIDSTTTTTKKQHSSSSSSTTIHAGDEKHHHKYLKAYVLIFPAAFVGLAIGIRLLTLPTLLNASLTHWIRQPGILFTRISLCIVQLFTVTSIATSVAHLVQRRKARRLCTQTALWFTTSSVFAAIQGTLWATIFRQIFRTSAREVDYGISTLLLDHTSAVMKYKCSNGRYLAPDPQTSELKCTAINPSYTSAIFSVVDLNGVLKGMQELYGSFKFDGMQDLVQQTLNGIVPRNLVWVFAKGNILTVFCTAIIFGIAMAKTSKRNSSSYSRNVIKSSNPMLVLVSQLNAVIGLFLKFIVKCSPVGVLVILVGEGAWNQDVVLKAMDVNALTSGAYLLAALSCASAGQLLVVNPLVSAIAIKYFKRRNPNFKAKKRKWIKFLPAQVYAFATSSSLIALPMTLWSIHRTKGVSASVAQATLGLGTSFNMVGLCLFMPIFVIFLVETSGSTAVTSLWDHIYLIGLTVIGSLAAAPVPNLGSLMLLTSIWRSFVPALPPSFAIVYGMKFLTNRLQAVVNVTADLVACTIISEAVEGSEMGWMLHQQKTRKRLDTGISSSSIPMLEEDLDRISSTSSYERPSFSSRIYSSSCTSRSSRRSSSPPRVRKEFLI